MKAYNNLNELQKNIIKEYKEWCKSARESLSAGHNDLSNYARSQAELYWRKANNEGITHLL